MAKLGPLILSGELVEGSKHERDESAISPTPSPHVPREVNSHGLVRPRSSPAVGRCAPSSRESRFPRCFEKIPLLILLGSLILWPFRTAAIPVVEAGKAGIPLEQANPTSPISSVLPWRKNIHDALFLASVEYRPVLAFFSSPGCIWCSRMKEETLSDPNVQELLSHFILVEVDVAEDPRSAEMYQVRSVPTMVFLTANGREGFRLAGFVNKAALGKTLDKILASKLEKKKDLDISRLIETLRNNQAPPDQFPSLLLAMKDDAGRNEIRTGFLKLDPFPRKEFVSLLQDRRLAVRLGALEILEEIAHEDFGFDPWAGSRDADGRALEKWAAWVASASQTPRVTEGIFTGELLENYLQDLVSERPKKVQHAMVMLERAGDAVLPQVEAFLSRNPGLNEGARLRLQELRYLLILPPVGGTSPSSLAHRLVYGNMDLRLKTLRDIAVARNKALPVLRDFLQEREPVYRETAAEILLVAGHSKAIPILEDHLRKERDTNVIYSILRGLRQVPSKRGLKMLCDRVQDPDEDLAVVALESIAKLKSADAAEKIRECFGDARWRVRVTALEATRDLRLNSLQADVARLLDDPDEFVRITAVYALAAVASPNSMEKFEEAFRKDDALKPAVIQSYVKLEAPIPEDFVASLEGQKSEILLAVIDSLQKADQQTLPFLIKLARHPNPDVPLAVFPILAARGMENADCRNLILEQLQSGKKNLVLAILQSVEIGEKILGQYNPSAFTVDFAVPPTNAVPTATGSSLDELFDAFSNAPSSPMPASRSDPMEDIFAAFSSESSSSANPISRFTDVARKLMVDHSDPEIRLAAACLLGRLGSTEGVPLILESLPSLTSEQRGEIAGGMGRIRKMPALELFRKFLGDSSEKVRESTSQALFSRRANEKCVELVFDELLRPRTPLVPKNVFDYQVGSALSSRGRMKQAFQRATQRLLSSDDPDRQTFGLILLQKCWEAGSAESLNTFLKSANPFSRRAASFTLGRNEPEKFLEMVAAVAKDPSEHVRMVIPILYNSSNQSRWVHYFDETNFVPSYENNYHFSPKTPPPLPHAARDALRQLCSDSSSAIRFEACFSLLTRNEKIEMSNLTSAIEEMPDSAAAAERISSYIAENYRNMDRESAVLLKHLRVKMDREKLKGILDYFKLWDEEEEPETIRAVSGPVQPSAAAPTPFNPNTPSPFIRRELKLVFFQKPGCSECRQVREMLDQLKETFPELMVEEYDITRQRSILYNEALCERFHVPENTRLIAPAVFSGSGCLVKEDITFDRLGQLLIRSSSLPNENWPVLPDGDLSDADQAIRKRFTATSLGIIFWAGLLDGVNPCAFATIIFLLSYLQVVRRTPRQIAQIGSAYILGVFLAYFLLGLGFVELISRLLIIQKIGMALNWLMAFFTLIIMLLNIRDGILALRGNLKEMTLQLPEFLKLQIHAVIREGAHHRRFIAMAFLLGVIISFLELACTGQVYAPTIFFMVRSGSIQALFSLLLYNLAFITPLLVIFILAYGGMRSNSLTRFLQKRAALVKFGTAVIFFLLFLFIIWGHRLLPAGFTPME